MHSPRSKAPMHDRDLGGPMHIPAQYKALRDSHAQMHLSWALASLLRIDAHFIRLMGKHSPHFRTLMHLITR